MDNQKIHTILQDALEEEIPSTDIHLWPDVQTLVAGKQTNQQGVNPMNTSKTRRVPRVALALFVVIALFTLTLTTPQGRSFAQEILQFFTRAESDSFPLDPSLLPPVPDDTAEESNNIFNANRTVSEIEAAVGFDVLEPTWLPDELTFRGANFDPENKIAYLFYDYVEVESNGLKLLEAPIQTPDCEFCKTVGASANVEMVQIGNVPGEFVEGVWNLNGTEIFWQSDPYLKTMRWQMNGMAFELQFMGPPDSVTKEEMITIAESLASSSSLSEQPTAEPPAPLITVAEAEAQAGFDVAELSFTPKGFTFLGARLYGNTIHLEYETLGHENQLFISQSQEGYMESDWNEVPEEYIVPVMIGDLPGEFVQGTFVVYPDATSATWNPDVAMLRLRWVANGVWFEIVKLGNVEPIEYLDQAGLIAIAEDLMR